VGTSLWGASSRNAGFACFGSPGELLDDLQTHDEDTVFSLVEKRWKGLQKLRKGLGDKTIDFHNWGGYEVFDSKEEYERCSTRLEYLNKNLGFIGSSKNIYREASPKIKVFGMRRLAGMLVNTTEGQIDTGKMISALVRKAQQAGVLIINGVEVDRVEEQGNGVEIVSKSGALFQCRRVVLCTNGFTNQLFPGLGVEPARAQVLITKPIANLSLKGTFHFDKGYYYFRNIGNRVLLGGGRNLDFKTEETDQQGLTALVQNRLEELLQDMILPNEKPEIEMRWSGIMGVGTEKTAIVKSLSPNIYCAVRMGGMGVAIGSLVGEEVARLVIESL